EGGEFGEGDEGYSGEGDGEEPDYAGAQLSEQTGKLDANGRLKITIPTTLDQNKQDLRYRVEARVTDESRREISGFNSVIATYGSFRIGVDAEKYMYQPGESIKLTITAKDYDGNPIQTPFHATIGRWKYREGMQDIESRDGTTGKDGTGVVE